MDEMIELGGKLKVKSHFLFLDHLPDPLLTNFGQTNVIDYRKGRFM
jgi:hypothetical protein